MSSTSNSKIFLVFLLGILSAFGPFVIDLYLPALPELATYFQTSASLVQLSLSTAMIGLALGQLLLGPISDRFGRKKPLLISLAIYTVSTVLIVFSPSIHSFIGLRILQGLSAAGSVVISRAVVADLYRGQEMTRFFGMLMTVNGMAPIVSPVLGSLMLEYTDWRGIFVFLVLIGVALWLASLRYHESLPAEQRLKSGVLSSFTVYGTIVCNRVFMRYVLMQSFAFTGMFAYIAASPFILQQGYGLSALAFSLCFAANGAALVGGSNLGGRMDGKLALDVATSGVFVVALGTALALWLKLSVWWVEAGFFLLLLSIGLMLPGTSSMAMESERRNAGSASAMLGFMPFFFGAIVSPLVGMGNIFHSTALAIATSGVLTVLIYLRARVAMNASVASQG